MGVIDGGTGNALILLGLDRGVIKRQREEPNDNLGRT
jgi:hypothetical protein